MTKKPLRDELRSEQQQLRRSIFPRETDWESWGSAWRRESSGEILEPLPVPERVYKKEGETFYMDRY